MIFFFDNISGLLDESVINLDFNKASEFGCPGPT